MARERYGIDAPTVTRNLAIVGGGCLLASVLPVGALHPFRYAFLAAGASMLLGALWMIASSLWLKTRVRDRLLDGRRWIGDEKVLDVGCGAGLVAIGAARRLTCGGTVHGVDLWRSGDLSGNGPDRIRANAAAAGVDDAVEVDTGDMRSLPYSDDSFDVVASMTAIHNIPTVEGRRQAIDEIWRVTKPGGAILIFDIRHAPVYAAQLRDRGARVGLSWPLLLWGLPGWRISAVKPA